MDLKFSVDGVKHEFDATKLTFGEARAIEKVCGYPFGDFGSHLRDGEMTTMQAMVWVAMKRQQPDLEFSDLDDVSIGDVEIHGDDEEGEPDPTEGETSSPAA